MPAKSFARDLLTGILVAAVGFGALAEAALRLAKPQDLTGSWFVVGSRGLVLNKAGGTARHQYGDHVVSYRFNERHQRGGEPLDGVPGVLVVGDSFTFGWLLPESAALPALLQRKADEAFGTKVVQFLNAGTGGWGMDSYLAYLEAFGDAVRPAAVLVMVNGDSFRRAQAKGLYALVDAETLALEAREAPVPMRAFKELLGRVPFYEWLLEHSHLVQFARRLATGSLVLRRPAAEAGAAPPFAVGVNPPPPAETRRLGRALLKRIKAWGEARGVPVYMASYYHPSDVDGVFGWLDEAARAEGVPFLDSQAPLAAAVGSDLGGHFFAGDAHPNEKTNALLAALVWPWLKPRLEREVPARTPK
jgi:lysophospholipase L1-like esterase